MKKIILVIMLILALPIMALALPQHGTNVTVTLTSAGSEYSATIPSGTTYITAQSRTAADFKMAFYAGTSGSNYFTVKSGTVYSVGPVAFSSATPKTALFFQSATAGQVIEVMYWN